MQKNGDRDGDFAGWEGEGRDRLRWRVFRGEEIPFVPFVARSEARLSDCVSFACVNIFN